MSLLEEAKIRPFCLKADPQISGKDIKSFFQSDVIFLNIPFSRNLKDPQYYRQQVESIVAQIEASPIRFVLFASSTSVYPSTLKTAVEDASFEPDNARSATLLAVEQFFMSKRNMDTTVIRFAGLYGGERKIGRILAGRTQVPEPDAPANLIHLEDCVGIVTRIIQEDIRGEVFNACSDGHPTRKKLYTKAAVHYGFEPPQFADRPQTRLKIVDNSKVKSRLNFTFRHPDPLDF
jgi:nucleoside-diphosphate-sugar epimerase